MRSKSAFSLVELMIVIGIIALLISLLAPSLARARASANQVKCAAQLHQIGVAFVAYAADNHGCFPGATRWHIWGGDGKPPDSPGPGWMEVMRRYLGTPDTGIYRCPDFPPGVSDFNYFLGNRWAFVSGRSHMKLSDIRLGSAFVLSADCTGHKLYVPPFGTSGEEGDDCDKDDGFSPGLEFAGEPEGFNVHKGGNNVLFGDYHVAAFKARDPQQLTFNPKRMEDWDDVTPDGNRETDGDR